jgi:Na+-driven multidrug efflux pump
MKDLTKGKISTLILGFAIPVFLGNLLQLTYSLADTRIVGSFLGERSLAAVGATTTISNLIVGFLLYRKVRLWLLSKRKIAHIKVGRANR